MKKAFLKKDSFKEDSLVQIKNLQSLLVYLDRNSPFYKNIFLKEKIDIKKIRSLDDLKKIPLTTKEDLDQHNEEFLCVPKTKIVDYVTTSGTLGSPVTFALTENDLQRLAVNEYNSFKIAGCTEEDLFQLMCTMDRRFMAGLAYFLGARKLGAGIIRVGNGLPELQWDTIQRISPSVLIAVPSFILKLIDYAEKNHIDYKNSSIKKIICIGESIRGNDFSYNTLGKKITGKWPVTLLSTYASTEMATTFAECEFGCGGHHQPELIIVEFLDENGKDVEEGEEGELVITTLGVEGMPLLRFNTGDVCRFFSSPCKCGLGSLRIGPILGRKKQMIKYKGTSFYPPALYDVLNGIKVIENYIVEVFLNELGTDEVKVYVGTNSTDPDLEKFIKDHFRTCLRVAPQVEFKEIDVITKMQHPSGSRKTVKFIDKR